MFKINNGIIRRRQRGGFNGDCLGFDIVLYFIIPALKKESKIQLAEMKTEKLLIEETNL